jgi:hypothetical protein
MTVSINQIPSELPRTKPPARVYMEGPMAPATYVAKGGFVGHQWEEMHFVI